MIKINKLLCYNNMNPIHSSQVFQPISLVLHGNKYLQSLSKNQDNTVAKRSLENMKIVFKGDDSKQTVKSAKDWVYELHLNGTGYLTLSRKEGGSSSSTSVEETKQSQKPNIMLITSNEDQHQTYFYESNSNNNNIMNNNNSNNKDYPTILDKDLTFSSSNTSMLSSPMKWRNIALGDIRERVRNAVESMRDFSLLHIKKINLPESDKNKFLNALSEAEKFIQMDVMVTTKKDNDRLFNFLQLPTEYTSSAQARVALQILNAAMSAWIFDFPILKNNSTSTIVTDPEQKINEEFLRLSKELYESLLDSVVCSTNYIE